MNPNEFLRLALDPLRLSILGAAASESLDLDGVAAAHGVDRRTVLEAYGRLRAAGLVSEDDRLV
ncbi:MAG: hypothetical protein KJN71_01815, partial [Acidimicrobiia bacterium]|nr:hypothetical protein [Acidimicrobiia bacterium]